MGRADVQTQPKPRCLLISSEEVFYYADTRPIEDNRDERNNICDRLANAQLVLGCV